MFQNGNYGFISIVNNSETIFEKYYELILWETVNKEIHKRFEKFLYNKLFNGYTCRKNNNNNNNLSQLLPNFPKINL